jgi:multiple sugar transport system ATP-binding protein
MSLQAVPMAVEFRGVGKDYGSRPTLRDVDLTVPAGAFVALIGPSGCGKSTLLRMIAGLEHIDYGEIRIGPRVVNDLSPKNRDVAMVFQNYALYPHMTVAENLGFSLRMARRPAAEAADRIAEAARILEIGDLLDRYPRQLSGGQRQRVAMGRAIVREPAVFLFDEPLSNLDAQLRVQMRSEIRRLHRDLGVTVIFVTHDQVEAMTMADIAVVMRDGRVEQIGAPLDLYDEPANAFVASFLGSPSMTLLAGQIAQGGGGPCIESSTGGRLALADRVAAGAAQLEAGHRCLLGMRPEHVAIARVGTPASLACAAPGTTGQPGVLSGEVLSVESTGLDTFVRAATPLGDVAAIHRGRLAVREGDGLALTPDPARLCLFDAADGRRIA